MKCSIILAIIASVLSTTLASSHHKVEKAHSEVMSYVNEHMGGVKMMRSNSYHLECYNGFLPLINRLALRAKEDSNKCVIDAHNEKERTMSQLDRSEVQAIVKRITDSLAGCSALEGLDYFTCLADNADANKQLLDNIKNLSSHIFSENSEFVAHIQSNEDSCIMDAVDRAKNDSDNAFNKLKSCIKGQDSFGEIEEED